MAINETCTGYINLNADNMRMSRYTVYILVEKQREKEIEIERESNRWNKPRDETVWPVIGSFPWKLGNPQNQSSTL